MAVAAGQEVFLGQILAEPEICPESDDKSFDDGDDAISAGERSLGSQTVDGEEPTDIYGIPAGGHGDELPRGVRDTGCEITIAPGSARCELSFARSDANGATREAVEAPEESELPNGASATLPGPSARGGTANFVPVNDPTASHTPKDGSTTNSDPVDDEEVPAIRKGRSIADSKFARGEAVLLSLDIETAGEYVGVVQLSAEISRLDITEKEGSNTKDEAGNVRREGETFNQYVNPETDLEWDQPCMDVHGLHPQHPSIVAADNIATVWDEFTR